MIAMSCDVDELVEAAGSLSDSVGRDENPIIVRSRGIAGPTYGDDSLRWM